MDIKVSSRTDAEQEKLSPSDFRRQMKQIKEDYRNQTEDLRSQLTESLSNILLGEKIPLNVTNSETGDIIIPANRKITKHFCVDLPRYIVLLKFLLPQFGLKSLRLSKVMSPNLLISKTTGIEKLKLSNKETQLIRVP